MATEQINCKILPVTWADIDTICGIGIDACLEDRQTQLKTIGKAPYTQLDVAKLGTLSTLRSKKQIFIKAVHPENGEILGSASYALWEFGPSEFPAMFNEKGPEPPGLEDEMKKAAAIKRSEKSAQESKAEELTVALDAFEGNDMSEMQHKLSPPGVKCVIVSGISVKPQYHRRGIGTSLLAYGTSIADEHGVHMWVHSSESAFPFYQRHGFEVVRTLIVKLDEYAADPPPGEGDGAKWGNYVIRYLKRMSQPARGSR